MRPRWTWACALACATACGDSEAPAPGPEPIAAVPAPNVVAEPVRGPARTAHARQSAWEACLLRSAEALEESVTLWRARVRDDGTLRPGRRKPLAYAVDSELMACEAAAKSEPGSALASSYVETARALATLTVEIAALPEEARSIEADLSQRFVAAIAAFETAREGFEQALLQARLDGNKSLRAEIVQAEGEGVRAAALDAFATAHGHLACALAEPRRPCGAELDALRTTVTTLHAVRGPTVMW
jgi:hypothetical protein